MLRTLNLRLAVGICLLALFLALPIISFGAISTRDQLARLQSGRVGPDKFDWAALRYDFGPSGRKAVERLARSANPIVRDHARAALAAKSRWDARRDIEAYVEAPRELRVFPAGTEVPPPLREAALGRPGKPGTCVGQGECLLFWKPDETSAVVLMDGCAEAGKARDEPAHGRDTCAVTHHVLRLTAKGWDEVAGGGERAVMTREAPAQAQEAALRREREAIRRGEVEIREVTRRQVFIGGRPKGEAFD